MIYMDTSTYVAFNCQLLSFAAFARLCSVWTELVEYLVGVLIPDPWRLKVGGPASFSNKTVAARGITPDHPVSDISHIKQQSAAYP